MEGSYNIMALFTSCFSRKGGNSNRWAATFFTSDKVQYKKESVNNKFV